MLANGDSPDRALCEIRVSPSNSCVDTGSLLQVQKPFSFLDKGLDSLSAGETGPLIFSVPGQSQGIGGDRSGLHCRPGNKGRLSFVRVGVVVCGWQRAMIKQDTRNRDYLEIS